MPAPDGPAPEPKRARVDTEADAIAAAPPPPAPAPASLQLTDTLAERVRCPICTLAMIGPIFQCSSGHVICDTCIGQLAAPQRCPACRVDMRPLRGIRCRLLEDARAWLPMPCHSDGCAYVAAGLDDLRAHLEKCPLSEARRCPHKGCAMRGEPDEVAAHTEMCPCRLLLCTFMSCECKFMAKDCRDHLYKQHAVSVVAADSRAVIPFYLDFPAVSSYREKKTHYKYLLAGEGPLDPVSQFACRPDVTLFRLCIQFDRRGGTAVPSAYLSLVAVNGQIQFDATISVPAPVHDCATGVTEFRATGPVLYTQYIAPEKVPARRPRTVAVAIPGALWSSTATPNDTAPTMLTVLVSLSRRDATAASWSIPRVLATLASSSARATITELRRKGAGGDAVLFRRAREVMSGFDAFVRTSKLTDLLSADGAPAEAAVAPLPVEAPPAAAAAAVQPAAASPEAAIANDASLIQAMRDAARAVLDIPARASLPVPAPRTRAAASGGNRRQRRIAYTVDLPLGDSGDDVDEEEAEMIGQFAR